MKCACKNCQENENGYCHSDCYIAIDSEGMCDLFKPREEPDDE